jgi:MFS transporter, ACS family, aldohexuronate transporter
MSMYASNVLQRIGSYTPIFIFASCAYLVALTVIHLIAPRYTAVARFASES